MGRFASVTGAANARMIDNGSRGAYFALAKLRDGREVDVPGVGYARRSIEDLKPDDIARRIEVENHARPILVALRHRGVLQDDRQRIGLRVAPASIDNRQSAMRTRNNRLENAPMVDNVPPANG